jgi:hypothetical protein
MFEIYPRERGIHTFQAPLIIQEHGDDKNLMDKLLLVNLINSSSPKYVHSQENDYNKCTSIPFMY